MTKSSFDLSAPELSEEDRKILARLDPPGAGIPWPARMVLTYMLRPYVAEKSDWSREMMRFERVHKSILETVEKTPKNLWKKRALVGRVRGLEDSSRYWSMAMTLEHICIVGRQIRPVILQLMQGIVPQIKADTAAVKPFGTQTADETLQSFRSFCAIELDHYKSEYEKLLPQYESQADPKTFRHPWFGPLSARGWHWLLAQHGFIHLQQLNEISKRLS